MLVPFQWRQLVPLVVVVMIVACTRLVMRMRNPAYQSSVGQPGSLVLVGAACVGGPLLGTLAR